MSAKPLNISISPDLSALSWHGRSLTPVSFTLTNNDTRTITEARLCACRADLLPIDKVTGESTELLNAVGEQLIKSGAIEARIGANDWQSIDSWSNGLMLGSLEPEDTISFEVRLNLPEVLTNQGKTGFSLMIAATDQTVTPPEVTPPVSDYIGWYTTSDADSVILTGGKVSQWSDKSGNGYHLTQADTAKQPTYNSGKLVFDGSDVLSGSSALCPTGATPATIFAVFKSSSYYQTAFSTGTSASYGGFTLGTRGTTSAYLEGVTNGSAVNTSAGSWTHNQLGIGMFASAGTSPLIVRINGNQWQFGAAKSTVSAAFHIGAKYGTSYFLNGEIAEIIVYHRLLSTEEMLAVEAYLNTKWMTGG